ncbi:uncharacterized protein MYCGRDRAFT_91662 [Zymoseptoria tritici IPO323]|uniref:Uncharacterized protein n=1 Tax=Zymoseptoria tritici (strain CBS 115943 / IPO323) TaxID=336722 RepID=F9X7T2_ZYMTI|nr:uncharacterized protein MYCGRDRAFT_91662 [Zymoseptoria tritici IPO323]EGP89428.1 hypothetical protein MYCGRDRAFT_91662 [Zymoseptoria tritici IPO323]
MQLSQLLIIASLFFDASLACGGFNVCGCFDEHNHMMCTEDLPSPLEETDCNDCLSSSAAIQMVTAEMCCYPTTFDARLHGSANGLDRALTAGGKGNQVFLFYVSARFGDGSRQAKTRVHLELLEAD